MCKRASAQKYQASFHIVEFDNIHLFLVSSWIRQYSSVFSVFCCGCCLVGTLLYQQSGRNKIFCTSTVKFSIEKIEYPHLSIGKYACMYTVHCTAKKTCLAFVFSWSSDHLRLSVHFITSDWLWPSYLSGTIWDQLSPSGTISLRLGPSHSMLEHLRPLRQSLSFEGSNHGDFLRFHIHVIILIQLVYHIHIGCKSSLLSYTFSSSNSNSYSPIFT